MQERRRQGIGSQLVRALLHQAASAGSDVFLLTNYSNAAAVSFYESLGGQARNGDDLLFEFPATPAT